MAQRLKDMGCDSICIKDMAALLRPQPAYEIVRGIKETCGKDTLVHVHVHSTTGVTMVSLMKAIEAGADIVDTSISSLSLGPGHNPTEALVEMLEGTGYTTRLNKDRLLKIKDHFAKVRPRYAEFESKFIGVETEIFDSQIPGGMISNMESQLKQQGAGDRVKEVLAEVPKVRKDAGYPPLVTPSSQIVGTQAVFNVLMGRYKVLTGEFADLMLGYYGETIGPRDPAIIEAAGQARQEGADHRPARRPAQARMGRAARPGPRPRRAATARDEDVLTYAMFPQVAAEVLRARGPRAPRTSARPRPTRRRPPSRPTHGAKPADGKGPITSPVTYQIRIGDKIAQGDRRARVSPRKEDQPMSAKQEVDGGADRGPPRKKRAARAGRRRRPPGQAEGAGQAHRPRAHRRPGRPRQLRGDRPVRPAPPDPLRHGRQGGPRRRRRHRRRRRSTAGSSTWPARTSPSWAARPARSTRHKVADVMELSLHTGSPFVFINDSGGARVQEGIDSLSGYGRVFYTNVMLSGAVPADLADLRPLRRRRRLLARPDRLHHPDAPGPDVHHRAAGHQAGDRRADHRRGAGRRRTPTWCTPASSTSSPRTTQEALQLCRRLLSFLPSNNLEDPPRAALRQQRRPQPRADQASCPSSPSRATTSAT